MHEVRVTHEFNFEIEKVFAGVSHHVEFLSTSKILCGMKRVGNVNPNGLGALREVRNGMLCFEEEITAFDPPHAYEYRILSLRGPFNLKLPFCSASCCRKMMLSTIQPIGMTSLMERSG